MGVAAITSWATCGGLVFAAGCVIALTVYRPALGYIVAIGALGAEGTVKVLLTGESTPFSVSPNAFGAALLDVVLFTSWAAVLISDRGRAPRALWKRLGRRERAIVAALGMWMAISLFDIFLSNPGRGMEGFRLTQAYALTAIAGVIAFQPGPGLRSRVRALLIVLALISAYAALRAIIGPAAAEKSFALSKHTVSSYGAAFRTVGSFSSAVGLESYLTPAVVFGLTLMLFGERDRALAGFVAIAGSVGVVASYGRASLVGVVLGTIAAVGLALSQAGSLSRPKTSTAVALVFLLGLGAAGTIAANQATPELKTRLHGLAEPWQDKSLSMRSHTWRTVFSDSATSPFGRGLGTVGSASASSRRNYVTADNNYLAILAQQGFVGLAIFVVGVFGIWIASAVRLIRFNVDTYSRLVGCAALAGVGAFLSIAVTAEYLEQPGKVLAWGLLGIAVSQAFLREAREPDAEPVAVEPVRAET